MAGRSDINWSYGEFTVNSTSAGSPNRLSFNSFGKYLLYLHLSYIAAGIQLRLRILHNGAQIFPLSGWFFQALNTSQLIVLEIDKMLIGPNYGIVVEAYVSTGSTTLAVGIASSDRANYADNVQIIDALDRIFTILRTRLAPGKKPKEDPKIEPLVKKE